MKAVVAAFNQEKALVGAFSVITNLRMEIFEALVDTWHCRYGRDQMKQDVATLRSLNEDLKTDCVIEVADNSKLKGEFR